LKGNLALDLPTNRWSLIRPENTSKLIYPKYHVAIATSRRGFLVHGGEQETGKFAPTSFYDVDKNQFFDIYTNRSPRLTKHRACLAMVSEVHFWGPATCYIQNFQPGDVGIFVFGGLN
jgi:hypothetical protein